MPIVQPMVAAFALVRQVKSSNSRDCVLQRADAVPATGVGGIWDFWNQRSRLSRVFCR